ncbi:hypothetical protein Agub_g10847 [Astrephomene gubernaculifera]|uniref:RRM domain-containing protein n=1 Tax=Astrephomene gubernaculifera TaxID=47775 RepID=A0AAD3DVJ9_9CHLO|nr:hypothetical protein Agub_g10847 [Astrephomene gubernaculifera]
MAPDEAPAQEVPPSSRLCVKNIPKYVDEAKLKDFFSAKGEVTDVKVLRTKDGRSRQLGFIGFKSAEEAATALRYYNKSYMDTSRLQVEFARKVGDDQLPRPWSKHTAGSTANKKGTQGAAAPVGGKGDAVAVAAAAKAAKGKGKSQEEPRPEDDDPKLREFMALMQPRAKARIWGNDELPNQQQAAADAVAAAAALHKQQQEQQQRQRRMQREAGGSEDGDGEEDEEEEYQDWSGAVARAHQAGDGEEEEEEDADMADLRDGDDDDDEEEGGEKRGNGGGMRDEVVVNDAVSDLEYLRSRMRRWDEDDEEEEKEKDKGTGGAGAEAAAARGDQSGVGTSPRCKPAGAAAEAAAAVVDDKAGRKVAAKKGATAAAAAVRKTHGSGEEAPDDAGGSEDADGDIDMEERDQQPDAAASGAAAAAAGTAAAAAKSWRGAGGAPGGGGEEEEEEGIMETGRLFVRNLAYTATESDLSELFGAFGDLQEVHLVLERETKRSKGLAYVQFQMPEDAVRAAQQLDGTIYQGRLLHILPAKRPPGASAPTGAAAGGGAAGEGTAAAGEGEGAAAAAAGPGGNAGLSTFKAQREAQRKADAGNRAAWNTLFMRADTVADAVAAHFGLSKAQLLDPTSAAGGGGAGDSVAVRMALGEAQVIASTKQALAEAGVQVEALERAAAASGKASAVRTVARSGTTLLVKNLPYSADENELAEMFGRCGPVARLVLPPARALALVEFTEPQDARAAFRSLAYKKYHHVPIYMEWAPADVFSAPPPAQPAGKQLQQQPGGATAATAAAGKAPKAAAAAAAAAGDAAADAAAAADGGGAVNPTTVGTIYVKNLAFATTDAAFRKHFDSAVSAVGGCLHSAVVARKKAKDGAVQSLGYGFVEVDSEAVAAAVIKKLQGSQLDGHKLALQLSKGRKAAAGGAATQGSAKAKAGEADGSTKLVVRNLAFEATKKDIQGLFNPFGHLKSCRLPKKFDGSHRGFAFVEFVTKQEARNALEGVGGTHLYGRRLVVEYAKEDDGLEELRNKTAAKFKRDEEVEAGGAPAKRLKV